MSVITPEVALRTLSELNDRHSELGDFARQVADLSERPVQSAVDGRNLAVLSFNEASSSARSRSS